MTIEKVMEQNSELLDENTELSSRLRLIQEQNLNLRSALSSIEVRLEREKAKSDNLYKKLMELNNKDIQDEKIRKEESILVAAKVMFIKDIASSLMQTEFFSSRLTETFRTSIELFEMFLEEFGISENDILEIMKKKIDSSHHGFLSGMIF